MQRVIPSCLGLKTTCAASAALQADKPAASLAQKSVSSMCSAGMLQL